jgi:putative FmdB family regulatory protein
MPLYEYQCTECGKKTEVLQRFVDAPLAVCPACGGAVKKLVSSPAFQFKGSGWYVTDYARKGGPGAGGEAGGSDKASGGEGASGAGTAADAGTAASSPAGGGGDGAGSSGAAGGSETKSTSAGASESKAAESGGKSAAKADPKPAAAGTGRS